MRKFLFYFLAFLTICFFLPALFTKTTQSTLSNDENISTEESNQGDNEASSDDNVVSSEDDKTSESKEYSYNKYATIHLFHSKTSEVEEVKIDDYLCNVVSAEMPASFELEALEAQAIVARTYTVYKINNKKHDNADICDDSACCQAWISKEDRFARWEEGQRESNWQKIVEAVTNTAGKIVTYQNEPINAFFHSNSGGTTEVPINVWGGSGYPYLQVVQTAGEEGYSQYASSLELTHEEVINKLKEKYADIVIDFENDEEIKILEYTESGRVRTVRFGNHELSGVEARTIFGLKSANFEIIKQDGKIQFSVKGYGHGVGMSQTGADTLAKQGKSAEEIIHHFYQDVEIKEINDL